MSAIDDIARADSELSLDTNAGGTSFRQKILDIWWRLCSKTGLTKLIAAISDGVLDRPLVKLGPDWRPTAVPTSTRQEIQALAQNFKNQHDQVAAVARKIDDLAAKFAGLSAPQLSDAQVASLAQEVVAALPHIPATDEFAKAVATELAARLSKGA